MVAPAQAGAFLWQAGTWGQTWAKVKFDATNS